MALELSPATRFALARGALYPETRGKYEQRMTDRDWHGALMLTRKVLRRDVIADWWENERIELDELRALLPVVWHDPERGRELRWWKLFRDAGFTGEPMPEGEYFIGYRGGQPGDALGLAWWLTDEAARHDALRWPRAATIPSDPTLMTGEVATAQLPRDKVVACFTFGTNTQLLAHPQSIRILGVKPVSGRIV